MVFEMSANVSRETIPALEGHLSELRRWNPKINLVAAADLPHLMERHVPDGLIIGTQLKPDHRYADVGSGGGFPGIVAATTRAPTSRPTTLIESDSRKSAFLRHVAREIGLTADVVTDRIERLPSLKMDVLSARALADVPTLLEWLTPHLAQDGMLLLPKGRKWRSEVDLAEAQWSFDLDLIPVDKAEGSVVLKLRNVARRT